MLLKEKIDTKIKVNHSFKRYHGIENKTVQVEQKKNKHRRVNMSTN